MAKSKEQKKQIVEILEQNFKKQKSFYLINFKNAKTSVLLELRRKLKDVDSLFYIAKKKLIDIVLKKNEILLETQKMDGQIGLVFSFGDEVAPAKILYKLEEEQESSVILGAYFQEEFLSKEDVVVLAKLPSRQELLAKLVSSLTSPMHGLVYSLNYNLKGLVTVIDKQVKKS